ncbi:hypothetical protein M413DRAFT_444041 [Hebeloma cylindrosporum]|uniref:ZP domain-containing protein n=1 Tax=Hebeloma cylindrosporum TaxID=76867 RepID=A0A0C3CI06_HEBCY|nr:hypothetical protein M413DRAFT_444041 [Hebeloma cylindrosporum h7]
MLTLQRLCVAIFLLFLNYNAVLASFGISVESLEVPIGRKFAVLWTSTTDQPQAVDICLNTDTEFIPIGSIQRNDLLAGSVNITLDDSISPSTYTLGIRFPGCSFLLAAEFNNFVVVPPSCGIAPRQHNSRSKVSRAHIG